jgi:hypothetical protein
MAGWEVGDAEDRTGLAGAIADAIEDSADEFDEKIAAPNLNALAEAIIRYLLDNQSLVLGGTVVDSETPPSSITVTIEEGP